MFTFEFMTMEEVFLVTYSLAIVGTVLVTLLGCWITDRVKRRK